MLEWRFKRIWLWFTVGGWWMYVVTLPLLRLPKYIWMYINLVVSIVSRYLLLHCVLTVHPVECTGSYRLVFHSSRINICPKRASHQSLMHREKNRDSDVKELVKSAIGFIFSTHFWIIQTIYKVIRHKQICTGRKSENKPHFRQDHWIKCRVASVLCGFKGTA